MTVRPDVLELNPVWSGIGATGELELKNRGSAPIDDLRIEVRSVSGVGTWSATLLGRAIAPGGSLTALVSLEVGEGIVGSSSAEIAIASALDGELIVPARAAVLPPPTCEDGNPCTRDWFDRVAGVCQHETLPDLSVCDDGSACTLDDRCLMGRCTGAALSCDDGVACTVDGCDPDSGCVFEPVAERCDDDDPCTADVCRPEAGCENPPLEDGALCHFDGCTEIGLCFLGACEIRPTPNGVPCEDGDSCTLADVCIDGACHPGPEAGVGPTEPVVVHPWVSWADLCAGPEDDPWNCYAESYVEGIAEVLAVERYGSEARVVWRADFVDAFGARCDPTAITFQPMALDPAPPEEGPGEAGRAQPAFTAVCSAPVFVATVPIAGGAGSSWQLTAVRGPVAAAFVSSDSPIAIAGVPELLIASANYWGDRVYVQGFDRDGAPVGGTRESGVMPFAVDGDRIAGVAIAGDSAAAVIAAHGELRRTDLANADCAIDACGLGSAVELGLARVGHAAGAGDFVEPLPLLTASDALCPFVAPTPAPLAVRDLSAAITDGSAIISFRASPSDCADLTDADGLPLFGPEADQALWRLAVDATAISDPGPFAPVPGFGPGSAAIALDAEGAEDRVAAIWSATETGCTSSCDCPPDTDCDCSFPLPCESWFVGTAGPAGLDPWVSGAGAAGSQAVSPVWLDDEEALAWLSGGAVGLVRRDGDGVTVQAGVAPAQSAWRAEHGLVSGGAGSGLVAGRAHLTVLPESPVAGQTDEHALLQPFLCGSGAATQQACQTDGDCALDERCEHEGVCLANPDCDDGCEPECWGACVPVAPDAGPPDDGGAAEDGGDADAGVSDGGAETPDDAGDAGGDAGEMSDAGPADAG